MSAYELARQANIARNKDEMQRLGLEQQVKLKLRSGNGKGLPRRKIAKKSRQRSRSCLPTAPLRVSARLKGKERVRYEGMDTGGVADEEEEEFSSSSDDDDNSSNGSEDEEYIAPPTRRQTRSRKIAPTNATTTSSMLSDAQDPPPPFLTVEKAKTGRSSCRVCRERIEKGSDRIGMKAWIVGRSAITWNHPKCFLENIVVQVEKTGRIKCKGKGTSIPKGSVKIGCRSHTATSWLCLPAFPESLAPVLRLCLKADYKFPLESVEGLDNLSDEHRTLFVGAVSQLQQLASSQAPARGKRKVGRAETEAVAVKRLKMEDSGSPLNAENTQPAAGAKTNAKGPVVWKFGSYLCHGTLLPARETKTHCYARTHKGNVKTLKKGGSYWWLE